MAFTKHGDRIDAMINFKAHGGSCGAFGGAFVGAMGAKTGVVQAEGIAATFQEVSDPARPAGAPKKKEQPGALEEFSARSRGAMTVFSLTHSQLLGTVKNMIKCVCDGDISVLLFVGIIGSLVPHSVLAGGPPVSPTNFNALVSNNLLQATAAAPVASTTGTVVIVLLLAAVAATSLWRTRGAVRIVVFSVLALATIATIAYASTIATTLGTVIAHFHRPLAGERDFTDEEKSVAAQTIAARHPQAIGLSDATIIYNAPGLSFDAGRSWVNSDQALGFINDEYTPVTGPAMIGDLVVYSRGEGLTHTGFVVSIDDNSTVDGVQSKWGSAGQYRHALRDVPDLYGSPAVFRSNRFGACSNSVQDFEDVLVGQWAETRDHARSLGYTVTQAVILCEDDIGQVEGSASLINPAGGEWIILIYSDSRDLVMLFRAEGDGSITYFNQGGGIRMYPDNRLVPVGSDGTPLTSSLQNSSSAQHQQLGASVSNCAMQGLYYACTGVLDNPLSPIDCGIVAFSCAGAGIVTGGPGALPCALTSGGACITEIYDLVDASVINLPTCADLNPQNTKCVPSTVCATEGRCYIGTCRPTVASVPPGLDCSAEKRVPRCGGVANIVTSASCSGTKCQYSPAEQCPPGDVCTGAACGPCLFSPCCGDGSCTFLLESCLTCPRDCCPSESCDLIVEPVSIVFPSTVLQTCAPDQSFTIHNQTGCPTLTGTATTQVGPGLPFTIQAGSSVSISPGGSEDVTVQFCPQASGPASAPITFSTNRGDTQKMVYGTGVPPGSNPDLATTSIRSLPSPITAGRAAVFIANVVNIGATDAPASTQSFRIDINSDNALPGGQNNDVTTLPARNVPALTAHSSMSVTSGTWFSPIVGTHRVISCADSSLTITESDETNNCTDGSDGSAIGIIEVKPGGTGGET